MTSVSPSAKRAIGSEGLHKGDECPRHPGLRGGCVCSRQGAVELQGCRGLCGSEQVT